LLLSAASEPSPTAIDTLSLHDALPIYHGGVWRLPRLRRQQVPQHRPPRPRLDHELLAAVIRELAHLQRLRIERALLLREAAHQLDRKSTRLNSSHLGISYAVFCLKKKK